MEDKPFVRDAAASDDGDVPNGQVLLLKALNKMSLYYIINMYKMSYIL